MLPFIADCRLADGGIAAITITDDLSPQMSFSQPYLTVGQVVVDQKRQYHHRRPGRVGRHDGRRPDELAHTLQALMIPGAQLAEYASVDLALQDLVAGYIDAVIADTHSTQSAVNTRANNLKIVGEPFASVDYNIAVCKDRPDLLDQINAGLAAVQGNGTLTNSRASGWRVWLTKE